MTSLAYSPWGPQPLADNDNKPLVIALSGVAGSGKSTAAAFLQTKGYRLVKFAGPLKAMCRAIGMSDSMIEGENKERPYDFLQGKTPRQFMQILGTEFGRDCIGQNFWIGLWERAVTDIQIGGGLVVVDDCRFANEAEAVRKAGGVVVRLEGRGGIAGCHSSEDMDWEPDVVLQNLGSKDSLYEDLYQVVG